MIVCSSVTGPAIMATPASVHRARACSHYFTSVPFNPPVRRASSMSRKIPPQTQQATPASSVRHTFKNWSKVKEDSSGSISASVSRITSVLNLDLPQNSQKVWQRISPTKIVTSTFERPVQHQPETKPGKQRIHAIHLREDPYGITQPTKEPEDKSTTAVQVVEPEQHDFATAITQMNSSVSDYLYDMKNPKESSKPFSKPPSVIRKEMQQQRAFRQQLSNLIPSSLIRRTPKEEPIPPVSARLSKHDQDQRTKGLVNAVRVAKTNPSRLSRLEKLCKHLEAYPEAKNLAVRVSH